MSLVRAVALKDASQNSLSSGANGTAYDLSSVMYAGARLYAGLHVVSQTTDSFQAFVQSATSSGFTAATTEVIFSAQTSRQAQWGTSAGVAIGSTDRIYWRSRFTLSTGSNAPSVKFLEWVSIR